MTNQIIREALAPYDAGLTLVTKVGARRGADGAWLKALSATELTDAVHDNLRNLGLEQLAVVNLRVGPPLSPADESIAEPLSTLVELQKQGLIAHLGLSTVTPAQLAEGERIATIVCVQNEYNIVQRRDDAMVDDLARRGIAYVPYFPLGGFSPLQSTVLQTVADSLGATPLQVAQAWLLQRSPNILLIAGTSSVEHLRENLSVADLKLTPEAIAQLNGISTATETAA